MRPSALPLRWLLFGFLAALLLARNLPWHLDDYDQAKQAFTSYEMLEQSQWWFQHTPSGKVATKPPLAGWISAGLRAAGLPWDWAWRLPGLVAAVGIAALLWKGGRQAAGELGGVVAVAAFGLNLFTPRLATLVRTDMLLAACVFVVGWLIYEKLRTDTQWTRGERYALAGALLASLLIKGPIAYAFLLPGLGAFCWFQRRTGRAGRAWSGAWSWFAPLAVFAAWVGVGTSLSAEFYDQVVRREFLGRFDASADGVHEAQPVWFYLGPTLRHFLPWSVLLVAAAGLPEVRARWRREPALGWLICWSVAGLACMSLVPSKRADRIFPALPPLALLLGATVALVPRARWPRSSPERGVALALGTAVLVSGGYAAWKVAEGYRADEGALVRFGREARARAAGAPERLAVVRGDNEAMVLYAGAREFTGAREAVKGWRRGDFDWLVLPARRFDAVKAQLVPFRLTHPGGAGPGRPPAYVLVERLPVETAPPAATPAPATREPFPQ